MLAPSALPAELATAVADGLAALADFQAARTRPELARQRCVALGRRHAGLTFRIVAEREPVSDTHYYELHIGSPAHGNVVLGFCPNRPAPWMVRSGVRVGYNEILRVDGVPMELSNAVQILDLAADGALADKLVTATVVQQAVADADDDIPIDDDELQAALDDFRWARGLTDAATMRRWLALHGLDEAALVEFITEHVRARRLRERVTADEIAPHFAAHASDYDVVTVGIVDLGDAERARAFAERATERPFAELVDDAAAAGEARYRIERWRRFQCPEALRDAAFDRPLHALALRTLAGRAVVVRPIARRSAVELDDETRRAVRDRLFESWIENRKRDARVEWNGAPSRAAGEEA